MANPSRGRPRLSGESKSIRVRSSVFDLWCQRKESCGFGGQTHSVFAEFLLHLARGQQPGTASESMSDLMFGDKFVASTPVRERRERGQISPKRQRLHLDSDSMDVDVTGISTAMSTFDNTMLNTAVGNPFSVLKVRESDSSESSDEDDFEQSETSSISDMDISEKDPEETLTMIEDEFPEEYPSELQSLSLTVFKPDTLPVESNVPVSADPSPGPSGLFSFEAEQQHTETLPDPSPAPSNLYSFEAEQQPTETLPDPSPAPSNLYSFEAEQQPTETLPVKSDSSRTSSNKETSSIEAKKDVVVTYLQASFENLLDEKGFEGLLQLYGLSRYVVSVDKLLELKGDYCQCVVDGKVCGKELVFFSKNVGSCIVIDWRCPDGHCGMWESSEILTYNRYSKVYANDSLLSIALILSGNNFSKFELFCKALNLRHLSNASFCHFQRKCALPIVQNVWSDMRTMILKILINYRDICLSGDGRNDSPGHSARYCVYAMMEHTTKAIVDLEVIDKRETGGNSTTMEKEGLRRLLERLMDKITVSEICTDASTSIIKLVRDLKGKFPLLSDIFHSLDIWHKAKKLTKSLHKAARVKGCAELKVWIESIVNHFWYCAQTANGNEDNLKTTWEGVLHHVCGEHLWAGSECQHAPSAESDKEKPPLAKASKAMEALRKIVLDQRWLNSLHFYVKFRHTGELENFNSMLTKYAPKRIAFEYPYFIMRVLLAALDHNFHLFRKPKINKDGTVSGHRKYSKRTQKYHAVVVKEAKNYPYFPIMAARMLDTRVNFKGTFSSAQDVDEFNPKQIAPTIGMKAPPPTKELLKGPSRFSSKDQPMSE